MPQNTVFNITFGSFLNKTKNTTEVLMIRVTKQVFRGGNNFKILNYNHQILGHVCISNYFVPQGTQNDFQLTD